MKDIVNLRLLCSPASLPFSAIFRIFSSPLEIPNVLYLEQFGGGS